VNGIRNGAPVAMSLERAMADQRLMDQIYATVEQGQPLAVGE